LQWFTGNIGFHHIHHLNPRIPNYFLEQCHNNNPAFQPEKPLTLLPSLKSLRLHLWDEENRRLVGFGYLKSLRHQQAAPVLPPKNEQVAPEVSLQLS
jgi:omega-6 fatty acid desaturase (delta-12 desaturase)